MDSERGQLRPGVDVVVLVPVRLYRDGISEALCRDARFRLVGSGGSLREIETLDQSPHVALVDLALAERAGATGVLRGRWPEVQIVALAVREADEEVLSWAKAGVAGLVSVDATLADLLDVVAAAARGEALTTPAVTALLLRRVASLTGPRLTDGPPLTRRECEIVRLMGRGLSNKEIAGSLHIELPTVKNHVHNILEKLRIASRSDAAPAALARGDLDRI